MLNLDRCDCVFQRCLCDMHFFGFFAVDAGTCIRASVSKGDLIDLCVTLPNGRASALSFCNAGMEICN